MGTQKTLAVWWNRQVVDFVTQEEAEQIVKTQPDTVQKITVKGHDALLVTTPMPKWRSIPV